MQVPRLGNNNNSCIFSQIYRTNLSIILHKPGKSNSHRHYDNFSRVYKVDSYLQSQSYYETIN